MYGGDHQLLGPDFSILGGEFADVEMCCSDRTARFPTRLAFAPSAGAALLEPFEGQILPVDTAIARRCAALHVFDPRPERDALIAATALTRGLTVVTRNVGDFEPMGVALLNPWLATAT